MNTKKRIQHWVDALKYEFYEPLGEISWEARCTKEQWKPEEALAGEFVSVHPGYSWGEQWEYCWFKGSITIPEEAEGKRIVLNLNPGGETTIFVNGRSFGTYRSEQCSPVYEQHHFMLDNTLTRQAVAGEKFELLMETFAGHDYSSPKQGVSYGPYIEGMYGNSKKEGERVTLGRCTYGIWNEEAYQLYMDVMTLGRLLEVSDRTSLRAMKLEEALENFTLLVDFEQPKAKRQDCYREARVMLQPLLTAENGSTMPVFYAVGNAHIDLAWLWPLSETYRKTARTFSAQLRMIEEYPDYKFIQSQPALYEMCKTHYPELFARIKEAVKGGQWIAEGGMWVEPDTNMAGGEALIRQVLYGKKYYQEEFQVDSQVLWLPDTFGYTAALPQILKGFGIQYLVTQKIFWSYDGNERFPYHYFNWQGMDGTQIVSFLPTSYTYRTNPAEANNVWKGRSQRRDLEAFLMPFGYGDGGGGPCRDHVEYALRQHNLEGSVRMKMADPVEFFEDMQEKGGPKNTYVGELYFSAHRGTYTTQAMMKKNNRQGEIAMRELELWSALSAQYGFAYPKEQAEELWKVVLLHQFHDILPGSCIGKVYEEAERTFAELYEKTDAVTGAARQTMLQKEEDAVTLFNSLGFERFALVSLPDRFAYGAVRKDGTYLPVEKSETGWKTSVVLPACGTISLRPAESRQAVCKKQAVITQSKDGYIMENNHVRAVINQRGEVISFVRKESGREFAAEPLNRFHMYKDVPRVFDAWDIDSNYRLQEMEGAFEITVEEEMQGTEAVLCVHGRINESVYIQRIRLMAEGSRLEFETEIDWKELHKLLKVAFPVQVYAENAIHEMQFGFVERPTHQSRDCDKDRFEVCNHRYTALCDGSHGAAVLNDCKYGISVNDNCLELTLLRAAAAPEFRSDNRLHRFTYAFAAWEGAFADCDVVRQAYELNVKPALVEGGSSDMSFMQIEKNNVMMDTMKLAEDGSGDIIVRMYEAKKAAVTTDIHIQKNMQVFVCDMMEQIQETVPVEDGNFTIPFCAFEIKTLRFRKETED